MSIMINDSDNTKKLEGGMIQLTDANGKEFQVNVSLKVLCWQMAYV